MGLVKRYGPVAALNAVTLLVPAGEVHAVLGPNGAGKTTLLRLLATLERPDAGRIDIDGVDPTSDGPEARRRLGYVGHEPGLYEDLTARETLIFEARARTLPDPATLAERGLADAGLERRADDRAGTLSRGMQQRLVLARATLHAPRVLLLDEPFTGLDAEGAARLETLLRDGVGGAAVLLALHDEARAARVAKRVHRLRAGRVEEAS